MSRSSQSLSQQVVLGCLVGLAVVLALEAKSTLHFGGSGVKIRESGDRTVIEARRGNNRLEAEFQGRVDLAVDGSGFTALGKDAKVKIRTTYRGDRHRLLVTPSGTEGFSYHLRVNGKKAPMDAEAREWLELVCIKILRLTGFQAAGRVEYLLASGEASAVLREIDEIRSDTIQRIYFEELAAQAELSDFELASALELAANDVGSDTESGLVLQALVTPARLDTPRIGEGFLEVTANIGSDSVLRSVLAELLDQGELSQSARRVILQAVDNLGSDTEMAKVLLAVMASLGDSDDVPRGFDQALSTVGSDFEHRRALEPAFRHPGLTQSTLANLLKTTQSIGSDFELAELLCTVANGDTTEHPLPVEFFEAASTIGSDGELRRVLTAVLDRPSLDQRELTAVLGSARSIGSDFEAAELLVHLIRSSDQSVTSVQAEFDEILEGIGSDFESERVREEVLQARSTISTTFTQDDTPGSPTAPSETSDPVEAEAEPAAVEASNRS